MPQITIDVPETLMPLLTRKAEIVQETPEQYIVSHLTVTLEKDDEEGMRAEERERLEDILEERDKGPFITITDMKAYRESIRARVMERVQQRLHA